MKDTPRTPAIKRCAITAAISESGTQRRIDAILVRLRRVKLLKDELKRNA